MGADKTGLQRIGPLEALHRRLGLARLPQRIAQVVVGLGLHRGSFHHPLQQSQPFVLPPGHEGQHTQHLQCRQVAGVLHQDVPVLLLRLGQLPRLVQRHSPLQAGLDAGQGLRGQLGGLGNHGHDWRDATERQAPAERGIQQETISGRA